MGEDGLGAARCVEDLLGVDLWRETGISSAGHSQMNDREPAGGSGQIHSDCRQFPARPPPPPPWACITGPSGGVLRSRDSGVVFGGAGSVGERDGEPQHLGRRETLLVELQVSGASGANAL